MIAQLFAAATRNQRKATALAILLAMAAAVSGVALLAISGRFLAGAALAGAAGLGAVQAFNYLIPSAAIRTFAITRTLTRYGERIYSHSAALFAIAELRPVLFARLAGGPVDSALARSGGEAAAALGSDVDALEDSVVRKVTLPAAAMAAATGIAAAWLAGPGPAIVVAVALIFMRLMSARLSGRLLRHPRKHHGEALSALKAAYADAAAYSAEIAVYGLAPRITATLAPHARRLDRARLDIARAEAIIQGTQLLGSAIIVAGVLLMARAGAPMVALAALAAAGAAESWAALARTDTENARVQDAMARLDAIASAPGRKAGLIPRQDAPHLTFEAGAVRVEVEPGQRLLIAGPSGCGKTRLLSTILGLRTDAPQRVLVQGANSTQIGLNGLRRVFAFAPQDAHLIAGSVADNLLLARPDLTRDEMWNALETACLADTVRALPDGLDHWLGNDGARLSGGQRKRLTLARAFCARRPWLVLDEPSEGLDSATESDLVQRLDGWLTRTGTGLILVSHRVALHRLCPVSLSLAAPRSARPG